MDISKLKIGQRYNWTRRNGVAARGMLGKIDTTGKTGVFAVLDVLDTKGKPTGRLLNVRPSQLTRS